MTKVRQHGRLYGVTTAAFDRDLPQYTVSKLKDHDSPGANVGQDKVAQESESVNVKSETSYNSSDEEGTMPRDFIFNENDIEESVSCKNVPKEQSRDSSINEELEVQHSESSICSEIKNSESDLEMCN